MTGLNCIGALKALGEETRLRILRLLFNEGLNVSEIAERLNVSQYNAVSYTHLTLPTILRV